MTGKKRSDNDPNRRSAKDEENAARRIVSDGAVQVTRGPDLNNPGNYEVPADDPDGRD